MEDEKAGLDESLSVYSWTSVRLMPPSLLSERKHYFLVGLEGLYRQHEGLKDCGSARLTLDGRLLEIRHSKPR